MTPFRVLALAVSLVSLGSLPACGHGSTGGTTFGGGGHNSGGGGNGGGGQWDTGGWGDTGGGGNQNGGGGSSGGTFGDECASDDDCSTHVCMFSGDAAWGYCSDTCSDWTDCPDFWDCQHVGNASGTYCVQTD